jgi:two-component SAPR family response regulator
LKGSYPEIPLKILSRVLKEACHEIFRLQRLSETLENTIKTTRDSQPKPEVKTGV